MSAAWEAPAPEPGREGRANAAGLGREALGALLRGLGEPAWRTGQLFEGIHRHGYPAWDAFTALSRDLRARLGEVADLDWDGLVRITESVASADGSTKHAFRLADGRMVEGVHMPYEDRSTLCLSSQVGCAMGCTFCATGQMGIVRNLTAAEITGQVMAMARAHGHPKGRPLNLVFMGMGEPLHNLDHVLEAFRTLTDPQGLAIPPRRITVSTSGLVPGIRRLGAQAKRPRLALSLNGTTDAYRSSIMPVNRAWNLAALGEALRAFPLEKGERITLEYVLLQGVTDHLDDARRLSAFARTFPSKVNLIPFNPHEGAGFLPPTEARIGAFCALLSEAGLTVSVRRSRGQDVAGACGQLVREGRPGGSGGNREGRR